MIDNNLFQKIHEKQQVDTCRILDYFRILPILKNQVSFLEEFWGTAGKNADFFVELGGRLVLKLNKWARYG